MNVVDSSGWLEFFADGPNADFFAPALLESATLIVPTISIFEVFKRVLQQRNEHAALQAIALMQQGTVVDLDVSLSLEAASLSCNLKLPLADSIIYATARRYNAEFWTQDEHFCDIEGVHYIPK